MSRTVKYLKVSFFIVLAWLIMFFTAKAVCNNTNSTNEWRECYSVAVFYTDDRFTKKETTDEKVDYARHYKKIYVKTDGRYYIIKTIDWENNVEVTEFDRKIFQVLIEYC